MTKSKETIDRVLGYFKKFSNDMYYQKNLKWLRNLIEINLGKDLNIQNSDLQKYRQNMYIIYDENEKVIIDFGISLREINYVIFKAPFVKFTYFNKDYELRYITKKSKKANMLAGWKRVLLSDYAKEKQTSQNNL